MAYFQSSFKSTYHFWQDIVVGTTQIDSEHEPSKSFKCENRFSHLHDLQNYLYHTLKTMKQFLFDS